MPAERELGNERLRVRASLMQKSGEPMNEDIKRLVDAARDYQRFTMLKPPEGTPARAAWDELAQALASLTTKETDHG